MHGWVGGECYYPMGVFQGDVYPDGYCWEISIDLAWKPELELGGKGPKIGQPHPERNSSISRRERATVVRGGPK